MTSRASLAVLVAAVLAVIVGLWTWKSGTAVSGTLEPVAPSSLAARADTSVVDASTEARPVRALAAEPESAPAPLEASSPTPISPPTEVPDLEAKQPLELVVVDEQQQPVFDATVRVDGLRSASDPGSWYQFRGEAPVARTDPKGRATLDCWTWVDIDGRTISVDLSIAHAEFVPFRDNSFALEPGVRTIVMKRGAVVSVRAWHGAPNRIVPDIEIQLEREAALGPEAWTRESDGRLVTTRLARGTHLVRVARRPKAPGETPLFSAIETFDVRQGERIDLVLELHGPLELAGKLDESVPRPVANGRVMLSLQETSTGDARACLWESFETDVRPDGTFTFTGLPPGRGYVFALVRGFVSERERAVSLAEAGITLKPGATKEDEERAWKDYGDIVLQLQRAEVPASVSPFTIQMVATGGVEITVTGPDGKPVAEANVDVSPNVQIPGVGSILVPWREWNGRADALGVARFEDLPPDPSLWVNAGASGLQMSESDRKDMPSVVVKPGEFAQRTIALERVAPDPSPK